MDRKNFLRLSLGAGAAAAVSFVGCTAGNDHNYQAWVTPVLLARICDVQELKAIGTAYRKKLPDAGKEEQLVRLLLTDGGKTLPGDADEELIKPLLLKKMKNDFATGNTVVVKGWIISETEAQQCALFSLAQN